MLRASERAIAYGRTSCAPFAYVIPGREPNPIETPIVREETFIIEGPLFFGTVKSRCASFYYLFSLLLVIYSIHQSNAKRVDISLKGEGECAVVHAMFAQKEAHSFGGRVGGKLGCKSLTVYDGNATLTDRASVKCS